jgi:hypothetical protein
MIRTTDKGDQLAPIIRDLVDDAVAKGIALGSLDRPKLTEQQAL